MPQHLKFKNIFVNSKEEVRRRLTSLWTEGDASETNNVYKAQIEELIEDVFAPDKDKDNAEPLVQSMYKWQGVADQDKQAAVDLVSPVWQKDYAPFQHQYESWQALLNDKKSIVVTTGTGSGKTESFMMPLIKDLSDNFTPEKVEALFLYPLNALMEDQKSRLNEYINNSGQRLKFAVYNGNTLERPEDGIILPQMDHELLYRDEIRRTPPNILLTNPTMLEYMLLRQADQSILKKSQGSLKWIVIDETHTFSGAGAAELALLIRRVLLAFNVTADKVRFATSSATIGADDVQNTNLKEFIAGISGKVPDDIQVITGTREANPAQDINTNNLPQNFVLDDAQIVKIQKKLLVEDFVKLGELIPEGNNIAEKLEILDALCEANMPAKVHYFFKVPDSGINVRLNDLTDRNTFKLYTVDNIYNDNQNSSPLLELCRCKGCQNFVAFGHIESTTQNTYTFKRRVLENENIFLNEDDAHTDAVPMFSSKLITFGIKPDNFQVDDNTPYQGIVNDNVFTITNDNNPNLIAKEGANCPFCSSSDGQNTAEGEELFTGFQSFRVSSEYISRVIAPRLLDEMLEHDGALPYGGRQFLSFVDSRQGASRGTLNQNLNNETRWVQSRVFNWLNEWEKERNQIIPYIEEQIRNAEHALQNSPNNAYWLAELNRHQKDLEANANGYKTWNQLLDLLLQDSDFELFCKQFIKESDIDAQNNINDEAKKTYALAVLFEEFNRRPKYALIAETLGFVQTYYPKLDGLKELPNAVNDFNNLLAADNRIDLTEWKNFIKIYLDFTIRANGSIYFSREDGNWRNIDITSSQRFDTERYTRKPAGKPKYNDRGSQNRHVYLLSTLAGWDSNTRAQNREIIDNVLNALWENVTALGLITNVQNLQNGNDGNFRMNLEEMALKVALKGAICPVTKRPIDTTFKGYSPYIEKGIARRVEDSFEWNTFLYLKGLNNNNKITNEEIELWAGENRTELVDLGLWTSVSNLLCSYPQSFIQAEHTAQVNKELARQHQQDFIAHRINILACSTTMEMGVDLGDLELVVMNSIPPHPANYKQRAGRSGRNDMPKSCAITLCNSDPIGMRTMRDPLNYLIRRPIAVPMVDLNSPQVVQRHINAFLFRSWTGTITLMNERIIDFFTTYNFLINGTDNVDFSSVQNTVNNQNIQIFANAGIGNEQGTKYYEFINFLYHPSQEVITELNAITRNTCFEATPSAQVINDTIGAINRIYTELEAMFGLIQSEWDNNLTNAQKRRLNFKFSSLLSKNLLMYLSTHQFTPNANMPVNIIEFDTKIVPNNWGVSNNPSYELQQALSQYVPGNTVVLDNSCFVVRGIQFSNQFNAQNAFKQIQQCTTCGKTWIDGYGKCTCRPESIRVWQDINSRDYLELIEPVGFTRDINEGITRIKNNNIFTFVNAQLIGADVWADTNTSRLFEFRSSLRNETSKILLYNRGIGYGFCVCTSCGKAVVENMAADANDPMLNLPELFNDKREDNTDRCFHYDIRKEISNNNRHYGRIQNRSTIKRNMLLGGTIQTDYCEIRLFDPQRNKIQNPKILYTLAIAIANVFSKYLGIERRDISFIVLQDTICIYDTAKGGAGYSKRLSDAQMLYSILDLTYDELQGCIFKEDLIDKTTKQFVEKIDLEETLEWLRQEKDNREFVPQDITYCYPGTQVGSVQDIFSRYNIDYANACLFLNNNIKEWNYEEWKTRIRYIKEKNGNRPKLCFIGSIENPPAPVIYLLHTIKDWADLYYYDVDGHNDNLYPVAAFGNNLFFTPDKAQLDMGSYWASDNLFYNDNANLIPGDRIIPYNVPQIDNGNIVKFTIDQNTQTTSQGLYQLLKDGNVRAAQIIDNFRDIINGQTVEITYVDEHLKSKLGIIITYQFIQALIQDLGVTYDRLIFENEKYEDKNGKTYKLFPNAPDSDLRDYIILNELGIAARINQMERNQLPHWRVLKISGNGCHLNIYPNGGFANGWHFDNNPINGNRVSYDYHQTGIHTDINIISRDEIMFDIEMLRDN